MKRPTSITVIAWILIVVGVLGLVNTVATMDNPMVREIMAKTPLPISVQFAMAYAGLAMMVVSGVAMLNGYNFGRWLYVIWTVAAIAINLATSPMKMLMIPAIVKFLVVAFFLFRPNATSYFTRSGALDEQAV